MNPVECHPFEPFLPAEARVLMLGTFPPAEKRWAMRFYYPNFQNDMWRIFGLLYFGDRDHFVAPEGKHYRLDALKAVLAREGFAFYDTATAVVRTKNTASDKDLLIVETTDFDALLARLPQCVAVATAGQLATETFAKHFQIAVPKVGNATPFAFQGRAMKLWRMPSTSRAYPLKIEKKAAEYGKMIADAMPNSQLATADFQFLTPIS